MTLHKLFFFSLLAASCLAAQAETIAKPSTTDPRTRRATYNEMEVYRIIGYYGYLTRIQFAPDETEISFALGDEEAWTTVAAGNSVLIKPSAPKPETNMVIITNKRSYNFVLSAEEPPQIGKQSSAPNGHEQQFLIVFDYPQDRAKDAAEKRAQQARETAEKRKKEEEALKKEIEAYTIGKSLEEAAAKNVNIMYFGCGAAEVLPFAAYDNREFTYLKFAPGQTIPSFFVRNTAGEESLVNYHVENDWVVIQRTFKEMTLRNGTYVGCLINTDYDTTRTNTGTVSNIVHRHLTNINDDGGTNEQQ